MMWLATTLVQIKIYSFSYNLPKYFNIIHLKLIISYNYVVYYTYSSLKAKHYLIFIKINKIQTPTLWLHSFIPEVKTQHKLEIECLVWTHPWRVPFKWTRGRGDPPRAAALKPSLLCHQAPSLYSPPPTNAPGSYIPPWETHMTCSPTPSSSSPPPRTSPPPRATRPPRATSPASYASRKYRSGSFSTTAISYKFK